MTVATKTIDSLLKGFILRIDALQRKPGKSPLKAYVSLCSETVGSLIARDFFFFLDHHNSYTSWAAFLTDTSLVLVTHTSVEQHLLRDFDRLTLEYDEDRSRQSPVDHDVLTLWANRHKGHLDRPMYRWRAQGDENVAVLMRFAAALSRAIEASTNIRNSH